jgi:hypothetical protein
MIDFGPAPLEQVMRDPELFFISQISLVIFHLL